jgi:hypothetical protein
VVIKISSSSSSSSSIPVAPTRGTEHL